MKFSTLYAVIITAVFVILCIFHFFRREQNLLKASAAALILCFVPAALEKIFLLRADSVGNVLYFTIIAMSVYLGGGLKFYDKFIWWDRVLHFLCGIVFVSFGIPLAYKMGISRRLGVLFFCFSLSTTLHSLWEVAEYIIDTIAHTDHQRWQKHSPSKNHISPKAVQPAGLVDTMNDIIICMLGTLAACAVWWFIMR